MNNENENTKEQIEEQNIHENFELTKENLFNEQRLLLRLKDFYDEINTFEEDCGNLDDEQENLVRKTNLIAQKIINNVTKNSDYTLDKHKIYPFDYKLIFSTKNDENTNNFNLIISNDGFELELSNS